MNVITKLPTKRVNYVILLTNTRSIPVTCEKYESVMNEDFEPILYRFFNAKVIILEIDAHRINAIVSKDDTEYSKIIKGLLYKPKKLLKTEIKTEVKSE